MDRHKKTRGQNGTGLEMACTERERVGIIGGGGRPKPVSEGDRVVTRGNMGSREVSV